VLLHPFIEVYGICHAFRKWGRRNPATIEANWEAGLAEVRRSFLAQTLVGKVGCGRIAAHAGRCGCGCGRGAASAEPFLRARIVDGLADRFHARVELDSFPRVAGEWALAEGKGLRIWPPARVEGVAVAAAKRERRG